MYGMFLDLATLQGIWTMHNPECLLHDRDIQKLKQLHVAKHMGPGHQVTVSDKGRVACCLTDRCPGDPLTYDQGSKTWSYATEPLKDAYPCSLVVNYHEHNDHRGLEVIIGWRCYR